jgi:hypothetical protein
MLSTGFRDRCFIGALAAAFFFGLVNVSAAQDKDAQGSDNKANPAQSSQTDPLKRQIPEKQRKANAKALKVELSKTYRKWLDEDVRWIITDQEKSAFMRPVY